MTRLFSIFCTLALVFSFALASTYANENPGDNPNVIAQSSVDDLPVPDVTINCTAFDCPISQQRDFSACITVDDCKSIPDARIKRLINNYVKRICEKLRECCRINGCEEFKCELVESSFGCRDDNTLCIKVTVAFKCQ